jgi:hypothetical protein
VRYPWFENLDNNKTKAHKFMKRVSKTYERTGDEEDKTKFDAACAQFQDLRSVFNEIREYDLYIEGIESGIKSEPRSFFKCAKMKRDPSGYPSSMFFESQSARDPEKGVNLFAEGSFRVFT